MIPFFLFFWLACAGMVDLGPQTTEVVPSEGALARWASEVPGDPGAWKDLPDSGFAPQAGADLGYRPGRVLLRMRVRSPRSGRWWLQFEYPATDTVLLECAGAVSGPVGEKIPRRLWADGIWHRMALPMDLDSGTNQVHLLVVQTVGRQEFSARWMPDSLLQSRAEDDALGDGLAMGVLIANLIAALFMLVGVRQAHSAWYVLYQLMVLLFVANDHHHAFAWIWPDNPGINQWDRAMTSVGTFGALGMFLSRLLDFRVRWPRWGTIHARCSLALVGLACLLPLSHWHPWIDKALYGGHRIEVLEIATWLLGYALCARLAWEGGRLARGVLLAAMPMLFALGFSLLGEWGVSSRLLEVRGDLLQWSLALENVLINLLLLRTIRKDREEHAKLLQAHLDLERDFSRRLAQETDRNLRGTALDLHDGVGQELAGMGLYLRSIFKQVGTPELADVVARQMSRVMESVRSSAHRIYPPELMEGGLRHALQRLAQGRKETGNLTMVVVGDMPGLSEEASLHWYRIAQEAVSNSRWHGKATNIEIHLAPGRLVVVDDGIGLGRAVFEGLGLRGVRQRVALLGCTMSLRPGADAGAVLEVVGLTGNVEAIGRDPSAPMP